MDKFKCEVKMLQVNLHFIKTGNMLGSNLLSYFREKVSLLQRKQFRVLFNVHIADAGESHCFHVCLYVANDSRLA